MFKVLLPIIIYLAITMNYTKRGKKKKDKNKKLIKKNSDFDQFIEIFKNQWETERKDTTSKNLSQALQERGIIRRKDEKSVQGAHESIGVPSSSFEEREVKAQISEAIDGRRDDVRLAREKYNRDFTEDKEDSKEEIFDYEIIDLEEENPWIEGIILSEILGKPKAMRK
ncbi:MAG: hypothetical protein Q4Q07_03980 [Tissierellia bacterium]|nr:hypothetical protein [Tissierellia bacterium]